MNLVMIILFILGCLSVIKAFGTEDPKQKKLYGYIALFIGCLLFILGKFVLNK